MSTAKKAGAAGVGVITLAAYFIMPWEGLWTTAKIDTIAREIYGADGVDYDVEAERALERLEDAGFGDLPCQSGLFSAAGMPLPLTVWQMTARGRSPA